MVRDTRETLTHITRQSSRYEMTEGRIDRLKKSFDHLKGKWCLIAQTSHTRRGPWRQLHVRTPLEGRPLASDITAQESEECRAPGRSPPRLMVFQGPQRWLNAEQRRSPYIFMSPVSPFGRGWVRVSVGHSICISYIFTTCLGFVGLGANADTVLHNAECICRCTYIKR